MAFWLLVAASLVLLVPALALLAWAYTVRRDYCAMAAWPVVQGEVALTGLDAERRFHRLALRDVQVPTVAYRYRAGGQEQIGSRLSNLPVLFEREDEAKRFLARFPEGGALTVRYNPAAPQEAVLEPRPPRLALPLAGALVLVLAAVALWVL
ncbi:DUF3592 domain-containing protein [Zavarzinia sp.]|uniref:DUF3592 domain-containing protein n=1 Tax=Zavarzinia sp. TaxID=2027920 RepID=UPI0035669FE2